jgi:hypothetical protein
MLRREFESFFIQNIDTICIEWFYPFDRGKRSDGNLNSTIEIVRIYSYFWFSNRKTHFND